MPNRPQPRPPVPQVPDPQAESRDAGFSLVEAIVAILLISIAVIPLMLAGITSIRVSAQTNTIAEVETVLVNAADRVNRSSEGCDNDVFVQGGPTLWQALRDFLSSLESGGA